MWDVSEQANWKDFFGLPDPYCVVQLENGNDAVIDEIKLEKKKYTRSPSWNSVMTFRVNRQCILKIQIYDEHKIRKDALLGYLEVSLNDGNIPTTSKGCPAVPYELKYKNRNAGTLWLSLHFLPMDASPSDSNSTLASDAVVPQANGIAMPDGWEEREDGNGRTYFVNHLLRRTQFERPGSENESQVEERRRRDDYEHRSRVAEDGWDQMAPNERLFFIDHTTKTTTWTDPRTGCSSTKNTTAQRGQEDDIGALPEGWEQRTHIDGRVFFIDHNSKQTRWENSRVEDQFFMKHA